MGRKKISYNIPVMKRFWMQVKKTKTCWLWIGAINRPRTSNQRGQIMENGKVAAVHRFAYERLVGPIPEGLFVLHKCDVSHCVNPKHLYAGTQSTNIKEAFQKGRKSTVGTKNPSCKLTEDQVREIRKRYPHENGRELAKEFGVSKGVPSQIHSRQTWKHIK